MSQLAARDNSLFGVGRSELPLACANHIDNALDAQDSEQMCS